MVGGGGGVWGPENVQLIQSWEECSSEGTWLDAALPQAGGGLRQGRRPFLTPPGHD